MNNNLILILLLIVIAGVCIWLFIKLMAEKNEREKIANHNAKLKADLAMLETENLKFQLQPHTLNNILANLKLTANKLNKGLASLSENLEYILYKGNNHYVSVADEIAFLDEYIRLNELFIHEIDTIKQDYTLVNKNSKHFNAPCIPHLITAYFIENAFKHGDINHKEALRIQIKLTDHEFELNVVNKLRQQPNSSKGGVGLMNMNKRLDLLVGGRYDIKNLITSEDYHSTLTIKL